MTCSCKHREGNSQCFDGEQSKVQSSVCSTLAFIENRRKEENVSICFYMHKDMLGGRLPCKSVALMVTCDGGSGPEMGQEFCKGDSCLCTYLYSKCSNYNNVLNLN